MPEISRFYGIVVKMFFKPKEHEPPHVHVIYGEYLGIFEVVTQKMVDGDLPKKEQKIVRKWLKQHSIALLEMWDSQQLRQLPPLE